MILATLSYFFMCRNQIRLASGLGKPIIPVVLESVTSSHNVRIQCLPIEFYISDATVSTSKVFWSDEQMQQLLVQISYTVAPCVENIASGGKFVIYTNMVLFEQENYYSAKFLYCVRLQSH